jgi:WS/DGAT/MGAT family acyltransferase
MPRYNYERLSAQDNMFLMMERPNVHMHVAATAIFEAGPLRSESGGVDIDRYKQAIEAVLHRIPRYRQKLRWVPLSDQPVWVDDRHFNLDYHIRHRALPRPGNLRQLKDLAAHIMSLQLDRTKPLWEIYVIEGLEDDRFAVISKVHHCMIDGASGSDLATILMSPSPSTEVSEPAPYYPRPAPSPTELVRDELVHTATLPLQATRSIREFSNRVEDMREELGKRARAMGELARWGVVSASETPINGPLSPHRRFEWLETPLDQVKQARRAFDCTVNDIVLAVVTAAFREYLIQRRVDPSTIDFRISAPVSVRTAKEKGKLGNRVSSWIIRLPIADEDPTLQLEAIRAATRDLKSSEQALGVDMIMKAAEYAPSALMSLGAQSSSGPINSIVTNVPGPQFPLYTLGAKLVSMFPQVPLLDNVGIGIALFSYDGTLCWGFNADFELIPDIDEFRRAIERSLARVTKAAGLGPGATDTKPKSNGTPKKRAKKSKADRPSATA